MLPKIILFLAVLCGLINVSIGANPSAKPTIMPTKTPTLKPSVKPSEAPTKNPTFVPTAKPTARPTFSPTAKPTIIPTAKPSARPTLMPTAKPTAKPTPVPTARPTETPTDTPTVMPTEAPTFSPSEMPTVSPTAIPTEAPTHGPTVFPTESPTAGPSEMPTTAPTDIPTENPTSPPTLDPTIRPTAVPTLTMEPTASPTVQTSPVVEFYTNLTITNAYNPTLDSDSRNVISYTTATASFGLPSTSTVCIGTVPLGRISRKLRSDKMQVEEGSYDVLVMLYTKIALSQTTFTTTSALYNSASSTLQIQISSGDYTIYMQANAFNFGTPDLMEAACGQGTTGKMTVVAPPSKPSGGGGSSSSGKSVSGGAVAGIVICVLFFVGVSGYLYYTEILLKHKGGGAPKHSMGQSTVGYSLPGDDDHVAENPVHHTTL